MNESKDIKINQSTDSSPGSFYVENLGCAKNQVDAEVMIASLKKEGWIYSRENPEEADLIIVNTCGFIKSAQEEAIDTLLGAKRDYPGKKVIAAGCLAQRWADDLPSLIPELDGVFGNRAPHRVSETVDNVMAGEKPVFAPEGVDKGEDRRDFFGFDRSVFVKIADGCNHNCRYCAIPLIKGKLLSRPAADVLIEVDSLLEQGVFEMNFVAQDLAAYGLDRGEKHGSGLINLLKAILDKPHSNDNFWIRLLYLHPDDFPNDLLDLMAEDSRILPYLDIPFQHASVPVLRKMGRSGTAESYLDLIAQIRGKLPDAVVRSTFMVGHPGEGRREFRDLLDFQQKAQLDWLGVFDWSREEGTSAAKDKSALFARLSAPTARKRKTLVESHQQQITEDRLEKWIGRDMDVLVEEPVEGEDLALGRLVIHAPEVDGSAVLHVKGAQAGDVFRSKITGLTGIDL
ncbi:MAG: 30S ribosomal protein S12 methylthiotransferase RimO, partial [Spirochaetaceae bacterium]|nr:30S ribosomal protein S12 methylthiotransferase RimO [Spirochaetaceae bacterium]